MKWGPGGPHILPELTFKSQHSPPPPPPPKKNERSLKGAKLDQKNVLYVSHRDEPHF